MISCIMPTFNRVPYLNYLLEESIECFIRQDFKDKELIIINDTPTQTLKINNCPSNIKVFNLAERMPTLSDKIQFGIEMAQGDLLCRWDDDDISLPSRLSYSYAKLDGRDEWRAENYFYDTGTLREVSSPGNTHIMSLWSRDVLKKFPNGKYPEKMSGWEDQAFNRILQAVGGPSKGDVIPVDDIYYMYRWATGSRHLSGYSSTEAGLQAHYNDIGLQSISAGTYWISPRWHINHLARKDQYLRTHAIAGVRGLKPYHQIAGYCDFFNLYDALIEAAPPGSTIVECGSLYGASLVYLANAAKKADKRLKIIAVDLGIGANFQQYPPDYSVTPVLMTNLQEAGVSDIVTFIAAETTRAAQLFQNRSVFAVFIDADHAYHSIKSDIQAWLPKVVYGGWLCGHDYANPDFPGVKQAVDEMFGPCASPYTNNSFLHFCY